MPKHSAGEYYTPEGLSSGTAVWGEKDCVLVVWQQYHCPSKSWDKLALEDISYPNSKLD